MVNREDLRSTPSYPWNHYKGKLASASLLIGSRSVARIDGLLGKSPKPIDMLYGFMMQLSGRSLSV